MKSEVAKNISDATPPEVKEKVSILAEVMLTELTEEEIKEAIYQGKKKKYFHEKNKAYWQEQENKKPGR